MVNAKEYEKIRQTINRLRQVLDYSISNGKSSYIEHGYILLNEEALSLYTELLENHPAELTNHILDWLHNHNWDIDLAFDKGERALVYFKKN